jgi:hypothetical protein
LGLVKKQVRVYNFTVARLHTYFVGEKQSWLVHNIIYCGPPKEPFGILPPAHPTVRTKRQVQNVSGTNKQRGDAFRDYLAQGYNGQIEITERTPQGVRYHDVGTQRSNVVWRFEAKNYLQYTTGADGQRILHEVSLTAELRRQVEKDVYWREQGSLVGEMRIVQWEFAGARPNSQLGQSLRDRGIPYVETVRR